MPTLSEQVGNDVVGIIVPDTTSSLSVRAEGDRGPVVVLSFSYNGAPDLLQNYVPGRAERGSNVAELAMHAVVGREPVTWIDCDFYKAFTIS